MTYDFTSILDRRGLDAIAVDGVGTMPGFAPDAPREGFDLIPMWVADMNFPTVPTVPQALARRAMHPAYGYFPVSDHYYSAIRRWQEVRNGVTDLPREAIGYENGVMGGLLTALEVLCSRGDPILLHSPTYVAFISNLKNNGYRPIYSPLVPDEQGLFRMDFEDMETRILKYHIRTAIFCSPHNPTGRVWERWEVEQFMALCEKHDVYVISDEIWSDILLNGSRHTPTQSVSPDARNRVIAQYAPSKTFNLAGLVGSYHIIYNPRLRDRILRQSSLSHYNEMNVFSMHALTAAYSPEGEAWTDQLCRVLSENVNYAHDFITRRFPGVQVTKPQGTYLLFLDCTRWCETHGRTLDQLLKAGWDVGVGWQDGRMFRGPCHIRMNLALPLSRVEEAMDRLARYVFLP